jgi:hypothetical protein
MYIGPVAEAYMADGLLDATKVGNMTAQWRLFQTALFTNVNAVSLVVASYVHAQANVVQSISMSLVAATQRRRQDQLR